MEVRLNGQSDHELAEAASAFNARYGEMETVLWYLSTHSRVALLNHEEAPVVGEPIWKIKSWWGVQGVRHETKSAMARALVTLEWSPDLFEPLNQLPLGGRNACPTEHGDGCSTARVFARLHGAPLASSMAHPCLRQLRSAESRHPGSLRPSRGLRSRCARGLPGCARCHRREPGLDGLAGAVLAAPRLRQMPLVVRRGRQRHGGRGPKPLAHS
jgi:hypothetical protein